MSLMKFKKNIYSQFGEDGILEEIINRLPKESLSHTAVEFGAWDGIHLSNIRNLILNQEFNGIFIEANKKKYLELCENYPQNNHIKINAFVTSSGETSLDSLLAISNTPKQFDLLSIDIDGNDYHVWSSLQIFRPKIVVVEYNPTIPSPVSYIQPDDFTVKIGSSARALIALGQERDYKLVAITETNLIFLLSDFCGLNTFTEIDYSDELFENRTPIYLFSGYDGSLHASKKITMIWHGFSIDPDKIKTLPKRLQKFPDDYNLIEHYSFMFFLLMNQGVSFIKMKIIKKVHRLLKVFRN
jgi:hypothetical protein